jgi:hypothetical protein
VIRILGFCHPIKLLSINRLFEKWIMWRLGGMMVHSSIQRICIRTKSYASYKLYLKRG